MSGEELYRQFLTAPDDPAGTPYWERLSPHTKTAWDRLAIWHIETLEDRYSEGLGDGSLGDDL